MFSAFFIRRPIFACVISIIILLAGFAAMWRCRWSNTRRSCRRRYR